MTLFTLDLCESGIWELRDREWVAGIMDSKRGVLTVAEESWQLDTENGVLVAWSSHAERAPIAYYPRRLRTGGTIVVSADEAYRLRANPWTARWRILNNDGQEVARPNVSVFQVSVRPDPSDTLLLVTLIGMFVIMFMQAADVGAVAPSA
jgi:hypothetical protein